MIGILVNPSDLVVPIRDRGHTHLVPLAETPFYQYARDQDIVPLVKYFGENFSHQDPLLAAALARELFISIRDYGYSPAQFGCYPSIHRRNITDGGKRLAFACYLQSDPVVVMSGIQEAYEAWSQPFRVWGGWLEVTMPMVDILMPTEKTWERRPDLRNQCYHTWEILELTTSFVGKSVLDLGCAQGFYCHRVMEAGAKLAVGIDRGANVAVRSNPNLPIQDVVRQAKDVTWLTDNENPNLQFRATDLCTWDPGRNSSDIVLALKVSYHMLDKQVDFLHRASAAARDLLIVQANEAQGKDMLEHSHTNVIKPILERCWRVVEVVRDVGSMDTPLLFCTEKKR